MAGILLDTHSWAWSIYATGRLSEGAIASMESADTIWVSPVSFYEISQKVRRGQWPEMVPVLSRLTAILEEQTGQAAPLTASICQEAGTLDWPQRDPFDRLIVATARTLDVPVITADRAMATAPGIRTIW